MKRGLDPRIAAGSVARWEMSPQTAQKDRDAIIDPQSGPAA